MVGFSVKIALTTGFSTRSHLYVVGFSVEFALEHTFKPNPHLPWSDLRITGYGVSSSSESSVGEFSAKFVLMAECSANTTGSKDAPDRFLTKSDMGLPIDPVKIRHFTLNPTTRYRFFPLRWSDSAQHTRKYAMMLRDM